MPPLGNPLIAFVLGFISGCLVGYFGHWLNVRRERSGRLRQFRTGLRVRLADLEATETKLVEWHRESLESLRAECIGIEEDIASRNRMDFNRALRIYVNLTATEIENPDGQHLANVVFGDPTEPGAMLFDFERGRRRIAGCLNALIKAAS